MGIEITYSCLGACSTRIQMQAYRDCNGNSLVDSNLVWVAPPGCTAPNAVGAWTVQVITDVTPICPSFHTDCLSPGGAAVNGVEQYRWSRDYDICSGTPCTYELQWSTCCRNGLVSIAGNYNIATVGTTINTALGTCNNSPVFTNIPVVYGCQGSNLDVHLGAFDPNGDSVAYVIGPCYTFVDTVLTYPVGWSPTAPLGNTWNASLDAETGILHLVANPGMNEVGIICITANEYRGGILIGSLQRDIQIQMRMCNDQNPTFGPISNLSSGATLSGDHVYMNGNTSVCFDMPTADVNATQTMRLWWDQDPTYAASASFVNALNAQVHDTVPGTAALPPTGRFCFTPPSAGTFQFRFRVEDSDCPMHGFADKVVTIHNGACASASANVYLLACPTVQYSAYACFAGPLSFVWSGAGGLSSTLQNPTHNYVNAGTYPWQVIVSNGALSDTVTGTVVVGGAASQTLFTGLNYLAPCNNILLDTLFPGIWSAYHWSDGSTAPILPVHLAGLYSVTVTAPNGCAYEDTTEVTWAPPTVWGHILTSTGVPLVNQRVLLVRYNSGPESLTAVDSIWTDADGYYYFCNTVDTTLSVKATPRLVDYPFEMPTYGFSTLYWNYAWRGTPWFGATFQIDFSTIYGINPGGPGFIGGLISQGANKVSAIGDPVPGLRLFLINHNTGVPLGYTDTDLDGYFSFASIPLGDYDIVPDKPGVSTTNVPQVTLTAQNQVMDSLPMDLHHYWLELLGATGQAPEIASAFTFSASPNPFERTVRIELNLPADGAVQMSVHDIVGKSIVRVDAGNLLRGTHVFELGETLPAGVYFLRVTFGEQSRVLRLVKQR